MMKIVVGAGSCGIAAGAQKVYDALESLLPENAALSVTGCNGMCFACLLYTFPSPRDATLSPMPSSV